MAELGGERTFYTGLKSPKTHLQRDHGMR
jgi:hypothetical protein